ncbi:MAG: hypothetical protein ONB23_06730 [candidate division KSB1 bacterium]|nr:hypothetical protein [candidate division KSB1 bacterium]
MAYKGGREPLASFDIPFVDPEQVRRLIELASKDPDQELKVHFIREVFANLGEIVRNMVDGGKPFSERLASMKKAALAIEDLATVHGYEGIETIAHNVAAALGAVDARTQPELPERLKTRIALALEAIQKILEFSGELNERILVDSTAGLATSRAPERDVEEPAATFGAEAGAVAERTGAEPEEGEAGADAVEVHKGVGEFPKLEAGEVGEECAADEDIWAAEESPFDIREARALLEWMAEDEGEELVDIEPPASCQAPSSEQAAVEEDLNYLFSDILAESVRETVSALEHLAATARVPTMAELDNALVALESLREAAEGIQDPLVAHFCSDTIQYLRTSVRVGSPLAEASRSLIQQVAQTLRSFLAEGEEGRQALRQLGERLQAESDLTEDGSDLFDEAVIQELRQKLEGERVPSQSKLRGKIRRLFGR